MPSSQFKASCFQQGFALTPVFIGIGAAAIAGTLVAGLSSHLFRAESATRTKAGAGAQLTQIVQAVQSVLADSDGDSVLEPPAYSSWGMAPAGGGNLPLTLPVPKIDTWGTPYGYCPWDHGTTNISANRITGINPAFEQNNVVFAIISAGPDKIFQTTCANAQTLTAQGDDGLRAITLGMANRGTAGAAYWGDPVADETALGALNSNALKIGEMRLVLATGQIKQWTGAAWQAFISGGGSGGGTYWRGPVANYADLPVETVDGVARQVLSESRLYIWHLDAESWLPVGDPLWLGSGVYSRQPLWSWGSNFGELGLGNTTPRSSPVQVGMLANWKSVAAGNYSTLAIKMDGTLWVCGQNDYGWLGLGDTSARSSPVQVGSLANWKSVAGGGFHTLAVKTDGTLWAWGYNGNGQLGLGDVSNRSSPVQVGSLANWKSVAAGGNQAFAVKTDGTLWAWGWNGSGQLGLGDVSNRSSPVQVGSLASWKAVVAGPSHTLAVKIDGTLWAWGANSNGQLGLGDISSRSSPVQVGSLATWKLVTAGWDHTLAVKTNGTLWAWGGGGSGRLGLGDTASRSSPVQVGTFTNWGGVAAGDGWSLATKSDGTSWAWGVNGSGQLGLGDISSRSSPVQVGQITNWKSAAAGRWHSVAIQYDRFY